MEARVGPGTRDLHWSREEIMRVNWAEAASAGLAVSFIMIVLEHLHIEIHRILQQRIFFLFLPYIISSKLCFWKLHV